MHISYLVYSPVGSIFFPVSTGQKKGCLSWSNVLPDIDNQPPAFKLHSASNCSSPNTYILSIKPWTFRTGNNSSCTRIKEGRTRNFCFTCLAASFSIQTDQQNWYFEPGVFLWKSVFHTLNVKPRKHCRYAILTYCTQLVIQIHCRAHLHWDYRPLS